MWGISGDIGAQFQSAQAQALLEQLKQQQIMQAMQQAEQRQTLQEAELGQRMAEHADAQALRGSQAERQGAMDRETANVKGVRRMIGESLMQRTGPISSDERRSIAAMQAAEGQNIDKDLLNEPEVKRHPVTVPGPGGRPVRRLVTEDELETGVDEYRAPPAPREPREQDYEWVMRGGKAVKIPKGPGLPGDEPYKAPLNTGDTAQDRQREARNTAARGFLTRLNELRTKINTKMGPEAGLTGMVRRGKANIGLDPDVAEYEKVRAAAGRAIAVAIMGAQNLSNPDADVWTNVLPGSGVDEQTAARLMTQVDKMLETAAGNRPLAPADGKPKFTILGVK